MARGRGAYGNKQQKGGGRKKQTGRKNNLGTPRGPKKVRTPRAPTKNTSRKRPRGDWQAKGHKKYDPTGDTPKTKTPRRSGVRKRGKQQTKGRGRLPQKNYARGDKKGQKPKAKRTGLIKVTTVGRPRPPQRATSSNRQLQRVQAMARSRSPSRSFPSKSPKKPILTIRKATPAKQKTPTKQKSSLMQRLAAIKFPPRKDHKKIVNRPLFPEEKTANINQLMEQLVVDSEVPQRKRVNVYKPLTPKYPRKAPNLPMEAVLENERERKEAIGAMLDRQRIMRRSRSLGVAPSLLSPQWKSETVRQERIDQRNDWGGDSPLKHEPYWAGRLVSDRTPHYSPLRKIVQPGQWNEFMLTPSAFAEPKWYNRRHTGRPFNPPDTDYYQLMAEGRWAPPPGVNINPPRVRKDKLKQ